MQSNRPLHKEGQHSVFWRPLNRKVNLIKQNSLLYTSFLCTLKTAAPLGGVNLDWNKPVI